MADTGREFIRRSRNYLSGEYLPKIRACLSRLDEEQIWWRPNGASNSVGNLVLHLAGNVRQWVVAGIGERPDTRKREEEFAAAGGWPASRLVEHLEGSLAEVDEVLAGLDPDRLGEAREIQGLETTVLGALYHAVEHFSGHTAQIQYVTKMLTGDPLDFYVIDPDGTVHERW